MKLINKLKAVYDYIEMARVTGVIINLIMKRGQQVRVMNQIFLAAKKKKYVVPTIDSQ